MFFLLHLLVRYSFGNSPLRSNSHHPDSYRFCRGSEPKPTGILGVGGQPNVYVQGEEIYGIYGNGWFAKWMVWTGQGNNYISQVVVSTFSIGLQSHVVLIGQVKRYFAYESRHQHGAFDMTGGFKYCFDFHLYLRKMKSFCLYNIFRMGWFNHQLVSHVRW